MSDPALEVHASVVAALRAATPVTDLVSTRIVDWIPPEPVYPFIHVDVSQSIEDDNACGKAWTVNVDLHIWSRAVGSIETKTLIGAVQAAVDSVSSVAGFGVDFVQFRNARTISERDGLTTHGVVTFELGLNEV